MLKDKLQQILDEFINLLSAPERQMFRELAEQAISLGYLPKKTKTNSPALDFQSSKTRKTILKLELHANAKISNPPGIRLKFYAEQQLNGIYAAGVKKVIEEFGGRYSGCYGCGKCPGKPEGYLYHYPDGHKVFRCGAELIPLEGFGAQDLGEIKRLLGLQAVYFVEKPLLAGKQGDK